MPGGSWRRRIEKGGGKRRRAITSMEQGGNSCRPLKYEDISQSIQEPITQKDINSKPLDIRVTLKWQGGILSHITNILGTWVLDGLDAPHGQPHLTGQEMAKITV